MSTTPVRAGLSPRFVIYALAQLAAATLGLVLGFRFGLQAGGGMALAVVAAGSGLVFTSLLADALLLRLLPPARTSGRR
jgi:hypothetical protein